MSPYQHVVGSQHAVVDTTVDVFNSLECWDVVCPTDTAHLQADVYEIRGRPDPRGL